MPTLAEKLHPNRFTEMSPFMTATVAYMLGESWTDPEMAEVAVSEAQDLVYIRKAVPRVRSHDFSGAERTAPRVGALFWQTACTVRREPSEYVIRSRQA